MDLHTELIRGRLKRRKAAEVLAAGQRRLPSEIIGSAEEPSAEAPRDYGAPSTSGSRFRLVAPGQLRRGISKRVRDRLLGLFETLLTNPVEILGPAVDLSPQQRDGHLAVASYTAPLSALEFVSDPPQRNDLDLEFRPVEFTGAALAGFEDVAIVEGEVQVGAALAERHRSMRCIGRSVRRAGRSDRK